MIKTSRKIFTTILTQATVMIYTTKYPTTLTKGFCMTNPAQNENNKSILASRQQNNLVILYDILEQEMHELKRMQACKERNEEWREEWNQKFGAKETILSAGMKIMNSLSKLIMLENKILQQLDVINSNHEKNPNQPRPGVLDGSIAYSIQRPKT